MEQFLEATNFVHDVLFAVLGKGDLGREQIPVRMGACLRIRIHHFVPSVQYQREFQVMVVYAPRSVGMSPEEPRDIRVGVQGCPKKSKFRGETSFIAMPLSS
jgi:hypothetical protein